MSWTVTPGSTDVTRYFQAWDTNGDPVTLTSASTNIAATYQRAGAAAVAISLSDLSAVTDAHSDGGLLHLGNGLHRIDMPDAAYAAGVASVRLAVSADAVTYVVAFVDRLQTIGDATAANQLPNLATTAPTGAATTLPQMIIQLWRGRYKKNIKTAEAITGYADDGETPIVTQAISANGSTETLGPVTSA